MTNEILYKGPGPVDGPFDSANLTRSKLRGIAAAMLLIVFFFTGGGEDLRTDFNGCPIAKELLPYQMSPNHSINKLATPNGNQTIQTTTCLLLSKIILSPPNAASSNWYGLKVTKTPHNSKRVKLVLIWMGTMR
jgi:hypothetical protein